MARLPPSASRVSGPTVLAGLLSALLHLVLVIVFVMNGGPHAGNDQAETPITQIVLTAAPVLEHRDGIEAPPAEPIAPALEPPQAFLAQLDEVPVVSIESVDAPPLDPAPLQEETSQAILAVADDTTADLTLSDAERAELAQQLARTAEALVNSGGTQVTWQRDDKQYSAVLVLERAKDGTTMDRVLADVSAENHGKPVLMHLKLRRLAFSSYSQVVDRWDPNVQMHDDAIDGRVHINSRFNLMYDRHTAPQLLGKVSTGARGFNLQSIGARRKRDIFRGGIETRAGRIAFPEQVQPFAWAPREGNARIHECTHDTRIFFFPDGSYTWLDIDTRKSEYRTASTDQPVYFIASRDATFYVKGVVSGNVLVYSPERIVIEGNVTYAHDPRHEANSRDVLGLVSDGSIEVAPARITGHEDLDIHAAILARRRFIVTDIEYPRSAMLRIFGSLAAGSLSATEPRYATKIEYDTRFEKQRPPGFPSTNRFALEESDEAWTVAEAGE